MGASSAIFTRINLRHLRRRKLRTFLTVAGIAAGVALTFSISVINATLLTSFRTSVRSLAGSAELEVAATDPAGLPASVVQTIEEVDGVENAIPVVRATSSVSGFGGTERVLVIGATPEFSGLVPEGLGPTGNLHVQFRGDVNGILLSETLAEDLEVRPGDRVAIKTATGTRPVAVSGTIGGDFVRLVNGGDIGVMLLPAAQALFEKGDRVDSVYVVTDPTVSLDVVESALDEALGGAANVGPPGERGQGLERVFSSLATLLSMGGTVALFVALFVVYNTMSMSLAERRREISMTLAFGAERRSVFVAFLSEAAVLGVIASAVGIGGGLLLASLLIDRAVEGYRFLPISAGGEITVPDGSIVIAAVGGLFVSVAGAFVPARRALRVTPIESLRPDAAYEWDHARGAGRHPGVWTAVGVGALVASAAGLVLFLFFPEQRWIVTVGLVLGLTGVTFLLPLIVPIAVALLKPVLQRTFGAVGRLAADALAKNPGRSTFTVAALVLTLGLVVAVASSLGSYQAQVERTAGELIGAPFYVTAESYRGLTSDQPLSIDARDDLLAVEGVKYVYPVRFALLELGETQGLVYTVPVQEAIERGATTELESITDDPEGFLTGLQRGEIVISTLVAETRGIGPGDSVTLPAPAGSREFRVAAIFDDLLSFESFYLGYETYARLWDDDKVDEFGVLLEDGASEAEVGPRLEQLVADSGIPAQVYTKEQLVGRILETVEATFSLANGVQLAALIVAALTIANTLFTAILERRWEMGLQRAIGMGSRQLSLSVLLEAAGIGLIGGIGGAILGTVSGFFMTQAMEAEFSWRVPFEAPWALMVVSLLLGVVVSAAAGLFPSRLAVRAPIIESLRYE